MKIVAIVNPSYPVTDTVSHNMYAIRKIVKYILSVN